MSALPTVSLEALTAAAREENRHAARKIAACYHVHREWIDADRKHKHYSRYGRTEMAVALGCSATVAEAYICVAVALHTRLPLLRAAFETGEIDLPRVRTACRILDNLDDAIVRRVEDEVVEAARRNSPGPLETAIWDILLRVAPEEAAALREFAKRFRTVTYSPAGELARIRAELTAPEAAAAWQLLEEMADTLCPKDPRGNKERLCDAFMARMHGEARLACLCRREDCPKKDTALPDRRVPLTMITVDIATLIGLLAHPAYLAGHGSIDPDLARELARTSQWQILLTEAVTLAESLGLAHQNPETGDWERTPNNPAQEPDSQPDAADDADTATNTDSTTAAAAAAAAATADTSASCPGTDPDRGFDPAPGDATTTRDAVTASGSTPDPTGGPPRTPDPAQAPAPTPTAGPPSDDLRDPPTPDGSDNQRRTQSLTSTAAMFCTHTPIGRGTQHSSALDLPTPHHAALNRAGLGRTGNRTGCTASGLYLGNATLAAALEAAIAADPTLGTSVARDPLTDRALIYRPDALTAVAVRLRDKHCRFPGCRRPATRCQLDHIDPFDHANPLAGGWTTVGNLQCLCEFHHSVKTAGYWKATMLPGGAILWRSTSKTTRITLPANGTTVPILGNDLRPHIPTKPRRSGIIAYPHPPHNQNSEPKPDTEANDTAPF